MNKVYGKSIDGRIKRPAATDDTQQHTDDVACSAGNSMCEIVAFVVWTFIRRFRSQNHVRMRDEKKEQRRKNVCGVHNSRMRKFFCFIERRINSPLTDEMFSAWAFFGIFFDKQMNGVGRLMWEFYWTIFQKKSISKILNSRKDWI